MFTINQCPTVLRPLYAFFRHMVRQAARAGCGNLQIRHARRVPDAGPVLFLPTHQTTLDPFIVDALLTETMRSPEPVHYAAWSSLFDLPILRGVKKDFPVVTVSPDSPGEIGAMLEHIERLLNKNRSLVMFPEGTLADPAHVAPIKPGIARMGERMTGSEAVRAVPIAIDIEDRHLIEFEMAGVRWVFPRAVGVNFYITIGEPRPLETLDTQQLRSDYRRLGHPLS